MKTNSNVLIVWGKSVYLRYIVNARTELVEIYTVKWHESQLKTLEHVARTSHLIYTCWPNNGHIIRNLTKIEISFKSTNKMKTPKQDEVTRKELIIFFPFFSKISCGPLSPLSLLHLHFQTLQTYPKSCVLHLFLSNFYPFTCLPSINLHTSQNFLTLNHINLTKQGSKKGFVLI